MKKRALSLLLTLALTLSLLPGAALAAGSGPAESSNINDQDYTTWSRPVNSYLFENEAGGLTRVEYTGSEIVAEDYSPDFQYLSGRTIPMELSRWGGFFAGADYNFFVFGQENPSESDSTEVIRVVKYSKDWQRLGQASLRGANTTVPFDAGSLRMDEYGGYLYIRTCHEMYTSSDGLNHQANLTMAVRQSDMAVTDSYYDVMNSSYGYVSHSFNQFLIVDEEGRIVALDHGDAYPRAMTFIRYYADAGSGRFSGSGYGAWCSVGLQREFAGAVGANTTGASVGGLAETSQCYMMAYNYDGVGGTGPRNVYLQAMDIATGKGKDYQITRSGGSTTPVLAPAGLDGGWLLWNGKDGYTVTDTLYYLPYGADGVPGQTASATGSLSDCAPIYYNGQAVWYVTDSSAPTFYTLDEGGLTAHPAAGAEEPEGTVLSPEAQSATMPTGYEGAYTCWGVDFSQVPLTLNEAETEYVFPAGTVLYVPAVGHAIKTSTGHPNVKSPNGGPLGYDIASEPLSPGTSSVSFSVSYTTTLDSFSAANEAGETETVQPPAGGLWIALEPGVRYTAEFTVSTNTGEAVSYRPTFQVSAAQAGGAPQGFEPVYRYDGFLFSQKPVEGWTFPAGTVVYVPPKYSLHESEGIEMYTSMKYSASKEPYAEPTGDVPCTGLWLTLEHGTYYNVWLNAEHITGEGFYENTYALTAEAPEEPGKPVETGFADVPADAWYAPYVGAAAEAGLMNGTGGGKFSPAKTLSLAEVVTLTARLYAEDRGEAVPSSAAGEPWYQGAYDYCVEKGLFTAGEVPAAALTGAATRFEMVDLLDRAVPDSEKAPIHSDVAVPDLAESAPYGEVVYRWYRAGITEGDQNGNFNGGSVITRGETATIFCRLAGLTERV